MKRKIWEEWIADYCAGRLSQKDMKALRQWLERHPEGKELLADARGVEKLCRSLRVGEGVDVAKALERFKAMTGRRAKGRRLTWWLAGAAAAMIGVIFMSLPLSEPNDEMEVVCADPGIVPGRLKAMLEAEDGGVVGITTASGVQVMMPDGTVVENDSIEGLRYDKREEESVTFQTLTVPVRGEFRLTLADGTRVWVNSASEVRFPTRFVGDRREIYVKGEIYMDVAHDERHPFIVHVGEHEVRVLGTKFNLKAYDEAKELQVPLVQGKVEVGNKQMASKIILSPGEQATFNQKRHTLEVQKVDTSYYTAWLDDLFAFWETPFSEVMRTLAQWYDFEYFFQNQEVQDFIYTGKIKRYDTLNEVLENFRRTGDLDFTINGNIVIVRKAIKQ